MILICLVWGWLCCIFFFACSGDHLALHSFPTRRSSDLHRVLWVWSGSRDISDETFVTRGTRDQDEGCEPSADRSQNHRETVRSEEHTSELQSQSNLVCRLLPEKKKPKLADNEQDTACTT